MIQTQLIYCGDNLQKLRELPDECIDLIYIDPPFNSNRNYEVFWGDAKEKRAFEDRFGAVEHYIHWMRPRIMELYRVLRKTGSFYYHCDIHANAYIRIMLDQVFGFNMCRNEIVWKRTSAHSGAKRYGPVHDVIYFYTKSDTYTWNDCYQPYDEEYAATFFEMRDPDGKRWKRGDLTGPGIRSGDSGLPWRGVDPTARGRHWQPASYLYDKFRTLTGEELGQYPLLERLDRLDKLGLIHWPLKHEGMPRYKCYLEDMPGIPLQSVWTDIRPIHNLAQERLGFPTQKPLPLLERILRSSSNEGDVVLDAFCGCGTSLHAAQILKRRWIGIDISPTACRVMAQRLVSECKLIEGRDFWVRDLPKTAAELRKYPPFEFENWAVNALNTVLVNGHAIANRAQVGDMGIDGRIYPATMAKEKKVGFDLFGESDRWFPVQVKQKDKAGRPDIDSFETAMQRQGRDRGFFISFDFTRDAHQEIARAKREMNLFIVPITVDEILNEEVQYRV